TAAPEVKRKWTTFALAGAALVIIGAIGLYFLRSSHLFAPNAPEKNTLIRLTSGPLVDAYPTFTRAGQIRFLRFLDKHTVATYVMNADGSNVREGSSIPSLTSAVVSPDETKVFFHKGA